MIQSGLIREHAPAFYRARWLAKATWHVLRTWHQHKATLISGWSLGIAFVIHQHLFTMLLLVWRADAWLKHTCPAVLVIRSHCTGKLHSFWTARAIFPHNLRINKTCFTTYHRRTSRQSYPVQVLDSNSTVCRNKTRCSPSAEPVVVGVIKSWTHSRLATTRLYVCDLRWLVECCARSRYQGQGHVITSHSTCGM